MKKATAKNLKLLVLNLVFILLCAFALLPIYYAFTVSVNADNMTLNSGLSLLPKHLTFDHYFNIIKEKPFMLWLKNSLVLSVCTTVLAITISVPAAYAFSRFKFPGRKVTLQILVLLNAFPAVLSMFAVYRILKTLNLMNSYAGLIIVYCGTMVVFGLWNMKGYFDDLPTEIEEAARIDGANDRQMITKIVLPLIRPSLIVTAVLILIFVWNEYIFATVFMSGAEKYTLAVGLYSLQATEYTRNWPLFSAASILTSLPVLIIFFVVQKYMVSGLTAGSVKG